MRAALLAAAINIGVTSVSMAFPAALQLPSSAAMKIHGCHHTFEQDVTGWHRHDLACRTLRGIVDRKNRPVRST
jgi:hypothetical protein